MGKFFNVLAGAIVTVIAYRIADSLVNSATDFAAEKLAAIKNQDREQKTA